MDMNELPLGFGMALARDPEAMQRFCALPDTQREELLRRVHSVLSRREMEVLVSELTK